MKIDRWFAAALLISVAACEGDRSDPLIIFGGGEYVYTATSPLGEPMLEGTLRLAWADLQTQARFDERHFTGTWEIRWAPGADTTLEVGPQVGSGVLTGTSSEDGVIIDLNSGSADNNVLLNATVRGYTMSGEWTWAVLAGEHASGRFTARNLAR